MISGTTKSGFKFEVADGIGNDFRIVEAIADSDSDDESAQVRGTVNLVRLVLGEAGKKALYKHLAETCGSVPTSRVIEEVTEIFQIARERSKEAKN